MHSAAILAGGEARRFDGRDKSALMVGGRTILDRQLAALTLVTDDLMMVTRADRVPTGVPNVRTIHDLVPGSGPLGGVHAALSAAHGDVVFVIACDMPFVTAPFVAHLLSLVDDTVDIVVPRTERGYHPLCAVYTRGCLGAVTRRLAERQLKMVDLLGEMRTRDVAAAEIDRFGDRHRLLANLNTPDECAGLEALHDHEP